MKKIKHILIAISIIVLPLLLGFGASQLVDTSKEVYKTLIRPPLSPPGFVFPIMWSILYLMMGISSYLIFSKNPKSSGLKYYALQLFVNCFWTYFFFGLEWRLFAFVWLLLLWCLILFTMQKFKDTSLISVYLLIPYFLWVSFAGYLNFAIYILN